MIILQVHWIIYETCFDFFKKELRHQVLKPEGSAELGIGTRSGRCLKQKFYASHRVKLSFLLLLYLISFKKNFIRHTMLFFVPFSATLLLLSKHLNFYFFFLYFFCLANKFFRMNAFCGRHSPEIFDCPPPKICMTPSVTFAKLRVLLSPEDIYWWACIRSLPPGWPQSREIHPRRSLVPLPVK